MQVWTCPVVVCIIIIAYPVHMCVYKHTYQNKWYTCMKSCKIIYKMNVNIIFQIDTEYM